MRSRSALALLVGWVCACSPPPNQEPHISDREPHIANQQPRFDALIQGIVASARPDEVGADVWSEVQRFYQERAHTPAWVQQDNLSKAAAALRVVQSAPDHGLFADYGANEIAQALTQTTSSEGESDSSIDTAGLAGIDVRLTSALLAFGHDVALGRTGPETIDSRWKKRRMAPDFVKLLASAANGDPSAWLPLVQPKHPEYAALQNALASLRTQSPPDQQQLRLLAINLERWRWMPDDFAPRHILVNVPAFHLAARENGRAVLDMKVVVGEADAEHETPIFSADMKTVVFSPYWNVPDSIVEGETAPALARDPTFLERNDIEILRRTKKGTESVDPATVKWDDEKELKELLFRQRPGPKNALGHVKFLLPNPFHVYLHDTPAHSLFARTGRALSHGCIRVERPEALAAYVLGIAGPASDWDLERIRDAMHSGVEKPVALKTPIPVHIVYFTAWPTDDGGFQSWPDVYGFDARQDSSAVSSATSAARPPS